MKQQPPVWSLMWVLNVGSQHSCGFLIFMGDEFAVDVRQCSRLAPGQGLHHHSLLGPYFQFYRIAIFLLCLWQVGEKHKRQSFCLIYLGQIGWGEGQGNQQRFNPLPTEEKGEVPAFYTTHICSLRCKVCTRLQTKLQRRRCAFLGGKRSLLHLHPFPALFHIVANQLPLKRQQSGEKSILSHGLAA